MVPLLGLLLWSALPAPGTGCPSLVDAAVAGQGGLTSLINRCADADLIRAAERATAPPDLTPFVRGRRRGKGDVISWKVHHRLEWEGTCLAQVAEALPVGDRLPAPACLVDAVVREEYDPNELAELNDDRAAFLDQHGELKTLFQACVTTRTGESCLEEILPRTGRGPGDPAAAEAWLSDRGAVLANAPPAQREMRCRAVLADAQSVVVRCAGTLAQSLCNAETSPLQEFIKPRCASDHSVVIPVRLGPPPSAACLAQAREAARAPGGSTFTIARRTALAACGIVPARVGVDDATAHEATVNDAQLEPATRALIVAVLRHQQRIGGHLHLPPRCTKAGGGCLADDRNATLARRLTRGCGYDVWNVFELMTGALGDGSWSDSRSRLLVRVKQGDGPRLPSESTTGALPHGIGNTHRSGNVFSAPIQVQKPPVTFRDLVGDLCTARGGDSDLCATLADGSQPSEGKGPAWAKVRRLIKKDWPASWPRFAREQHALDRGLVLDLRQGETDRQTCQPLLVDACTGDTAEVCAITPGEGENQCTGRRLPDGRCQVFRFARLPVSPGAR